ncbi:MAG: RDD family protein [Novosphingobium sp.]|nr:RDD family protein [Novosphingobium sp.]
MNNTKEMVEPKAYLDATSKLEEIIEKLRRIDKLPVKKDLADQLEDDVKDLLNINEGWQVQYAFDDLLKLVSENYNLSEDELNFRRQIKEAIKFKVKTMNGITWKRRDPAFLIDFFIASSIGALIIGESGQDSLENSLLWLGIILLYFIILNYYFNTTIGQRIFNIKLIDKNGIRPNFTQVLFRELLFLTVISGVGTICWLIFGRYWDNLTKTRLVFFNKK